MITILSIALIITTISTIYLILSRAKCFSEIDKQKEDGK